MVGVLLLVVGLGAGWAAAVRFQSPAQRAADASPPAAQPVLVPVGEGRLEQIVTAQAGVGPASTVKLAVPQGSGARVVTATPLAAGASVTAGSLLLEVSGRPVFALPGAFPFYRDLSEGDTGPDVRQLQSALQQVPGLPRVGVDGQFGSRTAAAVRALYRSAGYATDLVETEVAADPVAAVSSGTAADPATESGSEESQNQMPAQSVATTKTVLTVPLGDVLVVASLPATVSAVPAVGQTLTSESTVDLATGVLVARSQVPPAVATALATGSPVRLDGPDGTSVRAVTAPVTVDPAATEVTLGYVTDGAIPDSWRGAGALATITQQAVAGEGLLVPSRALSSRADGALAVLVRQDDEALLEVRVRELGQLSGQSMIEPVSAGELVVGDLVVVRS